MRPGQEFIRFLRRHHSQGHRVRWGRSYIPDCKGFAKDPDSLVAKCRDCGAEYHRKEKEE